MTHLVIVSMRHGVTAWWLEVYARQLCWIWKSSIYHMRRYVWESTDMGGFDGVRRYREACRSLNGLHGVMSVLAQGLLSRKKNLFLYS